MLFLVIALSRYFPHLNPQAVKGEVRVLSESAGSCLTSTQNNPFVKVAHLRFLLGEREAMYAATLDTFYSSIPQDLFSKNKDMFLHNHNAITNIKSLTFIQYYGLTHSQYANVSNCSCNILYSFFLRSRFAFSYHVSLVFKLEHFLRSYFAFRP